MLYLNFILMLLKSIMWLCSRYVLLCGHSMSNQHKTKPTSLDFDDTQAIVWVYGDNNPHQFLASYVICLLSYNNSNFWSFCWYRVTVMAISRILKGIRIWQLYHCKLHLVLYLLIYGMYSLIRLEVKGHRH